MNTNNLYDQYKTKMQKIADVKYAAAVLQWDQETYLPSKGNESRARQLATLTEMAHELSTDQTLGELLMELNAREGLNEKEKRNVSLSLEDFERNSRLNPSFVRQVSETVTRCYHDWVKARQENSFSFFRDALHQLINLKKAEAEMLGYSGHPYNALMNDYDKGLTVSEVDGVFNNLKPQLLSLLDKIKGKDINNLFLKKHFNKDKQWNFGLEMLKTIGFDFEAGRQDISIHPFTTNFSNTDVRVTTRIEENDFGSMTWSCLHEGGHALYEQGLPGDQYGLPLGEYCSLSIHESQSRLWENCIGRSLPFWKHQYPKLQKLFPDQLNNVEITGFYKGINKFEPSLIRIEADELTYHFHVMIRYEIEKLLIEGSIGTDEIPAYWNEHYRKYLGVEVPDDKRGCLQDIHWSHGSFGYFSTYSLGSLYAAQFKAAADKMISAEEGSDDYNRQMLEWLRNNIHHTGRYYHSGELCRKITGEALNPSWFMEYAIKKYTDIYSS